MIVPIHRIIPLIFLAAILTGCRNREEPAHTPATVSTPASPVPDSAASSVTVDSSQSLVDDAQVTISPGGLPDSLRKYEIESAIVEYWNSWLNRRQTLYIDDFGSKEAYYTAPEMGGASPAPPYDVSIQADGWRYDYSSTAGIGQSQRKDVASGPLLGVVQDVWSLPENLQQEFALRKLGRKKLLGKDAIGYAFNYNGRTEVWLWKGIPLSMEIVRQVEQGGEAVIGFEATSIRTDMEIPAEKFQVPATIALKQL